jgi:hypothetical protein
MARIIQELKEKIKSDDEQLEMRRKEYCIEEEFDTVKSLYDEKKELPDGINHEVVVTYDGTKEDRFYRLVDENLSDEEWKEYIALKQYMDIHTIKKCVVFFTVLAIISLILGIIAGINLSDLLS